MQKLKTFLWLAGAWVLGWILFQYYPEDPTWWYYTSAPEVYHHPFGWVGATCAAFLYMLLGNAAWGVPGIVFLVGYALNRKVARERLMCLVATGCLLIIALAALCKSYHLSSWGIPAGGALGLGAYHILCMFLGSALVPYAASCIVAGCCVTMLGTQRLQIFCSYLRYGVVRYVTLPAQYGVACLTDTMQSLSNRIRPSSRVVAPETTFSDDVLIDIPEATSREKRAPHKPARERVKTSPPAQPLLSIVWGNRETPAAVSHDEYQQQARTLEQKLQQFGIEGKVVNVVVGPVIVLFEYQPLSSVPLNKIIAREYDLALALEATSFRIIAPIPGKALVGFECSRAEQEIVSFADYHKELLKPNHRLPLLLGVTSAGGPMVFDLSKLPHLLVAGSTGSGKSVVLHTIIMSIMSSRSCDETHLILIDPKRLEFAVYADIPHLLFPIIVEPHEAVKVLRWLVQEMERRYQALAQAQVTDIASYRRKGEEGQAPTMPDIVMVIDEWADLMMTGGKEAEHSLVRLAQMARAAGIHVVVATQRPSVDIITGLIKVNIPARIACKVISKIDSRTIIDMSGAEKLLGKGDMLVMVPGVPLMRGQGMYLSSRDIEEVVCYVRRQRPVAYRTYSEPASTALEVAAEDETLYQQALDVIKSVDEVSISFLQRKLRIGYNRSARMIDYLEAHGMILPSDGGKTRKVVHSKDNI